MTNMPIIAKWTTGVNLQSPSYSDGGGGGTKGLSKSASAHPINFDLPGKERPTPAPRLSITRNSLQTSLSSSSMNNSQDSGILSNKSGLSQGTSSSQNDSTLPTDEHSDSEQHQHSKHLAIDAMNEDDHLRAPPPPLPPKPKKLPIKPSNWGHSNAKNIYLDQPTSSFV